MTALAGHVQFVGAFPKSAMAGLAIASEPYGGDTCHGETARCAMVAQIGLQHASVTLLDNGRGLCAIDGLIEPDRLLAHWDRDHVERLLDLRRDYAFALWEERGDELVLARSPFSSRYLAYRIDHDAVAFATQPAALTKSLDVDAIAERLVANDYFGSSRTVFDGVLAVEPGTVVRIGRDGARVERFWQPWSSPNAWSDEEAAQALRERLANCVSDRIAEVGDRPLATHLSSGRDSSAVTMTAAGVSAAPVHALTAAPKLGVPEAAGEFRLDESQLAASVASRCGAEHHVVRPDRFRLCDAMDRAHRVHQEPLANPLNMAWWDGLSEEAHGLGAAVLFSAQCGNFTVSAGGPAALADLWRSDPRHWLSVARAIGGRSPRRWRHVLASTFGARVPARLYRAIHALFGQQRTPRTFPFLQGPLRAATAEYVAVAEADPRPFPSFRERLASVARRMDMSDKTASVLHGVDVIDPTADPRLVEWVLSLSDAQLASAQDRRPIFALAFPDLPDAVCRPLSRTLQSGDYARVLDLDDLSAGIERYGRHPLVAELIDLGEMRAQLDRWPTDLGLDRATYDRIADQFLRSLAVASFIWVHIPQD